MARFDVYMTGEGTMVVDCQADFLSDIGTRFVIPLMPASEAPPSNSRLNPLIPFDGDDLVLVVQLATTIRVKELRRRLGHVRDHDTQVTGAIDVLIGAG